MTIEFKMSKLFGDFLMDGSKANRFRHEEVLPELASKNDIVFDMDGVDGMTSSFANALIANLIRTNKKDFFAHVRFKNCTETVKTHVKLSIRFGEKLEPIAV